MKALSVILTGCIVLMASLAASPALAMTRLTDRTINEAIVYGMENQGEGLSTFLGGNWREGSDGALLNIYTPFMEIARSAANRHLPTDVTPETLGDARKKIIEDIDYVYKHPTVKFMVSLYGDTSGFAKGYYAMIEGVGKGRSVRLYPVKSIQQHLAEQEKEVEIKPYSAINAYQFRFEDIAPLDEFTLKLYGENLEPIVFKIHSKEIQ